MIWYLDWFNYVMNEIVVLFMTCLISYILLPSNRGLFAQSSLFDGNIFPVLMEDLFPNSDLTLLGKEPAIDISDLIVVEYPYPGQTLSTNVPLALGILERVKTPKSEKS